MKKLQKLTSKISGKVLFHAASMMVAVGAMAVTLCAVPYWHNEPVMPESLRED